MLEKDEEEEGKYELSGEILLRQASPTETWGENVSNGGTFHSPKSSFSTFNVVSSSLDEVNDWTKWDWRTNERNIICMKAQVRGMEDDGMEWDDDGDEKKWKWRKWKAFLKSKKFWMFILLSLLLCKIKRAESVEGI